MARDIEDLGGRDPHALLGVRRGATSHQVQQAFRRRAMSGGHPDHGGDNATFRALTRAREILLDPQRLDAYDAAVRARTASSRERVPTAATFTGSPDRDASKPPTSTPTGTPRSRPPGASTAGPAAASGTGGWGVATVVLALLGPLVWPVAIVVGHIAVRRARLAGRNSGSAIPVVLVLLYVLSFLVLPRLLVMTIATFAG